MGRELEGALRERMEEPPLQSLLGFQEAQRDVVEKVYVAVDNGLDHGGAMDILVHELPGRREKERNSSQHVRRESQYAAGSV